MSKVRLTQSMKDKSKTITIDPRDIGALERALTDRRKACDIGVRITDRETKEKLIQEVDSLERIEKQLQ